MDDKPFFVFSMDAIRRTDPSVLDRFGRHTFNFDDILAEAGRLKLESQLRIEIEKEFALPSDEFIKMMASRVQAGRITASIRDQLQSAITASIASIIRDRVNERLTSALNVANPPAEMISDGASDDMSDAGDGIITTDDEIAGFRIVQAIASRHIDPKRIVIRDSKSYCAILLDDNNRRTLARLHFNSPTTRYIGTFTEKTETRHAVSALTDIYKFENEILTRIKEFESSSG